MKKSVYFLCTAILLGIFAVSQNAQKVWEKSADQWSSEDIELIMNKSPWAVSQELRLRNQGRINSVAGTGNIIIGDSIESSLEPPTDFTFTLRLRSGAPIRLALVRKKEIEENFEKLKGKERSAFIEKYKGLLECPACTDNYVLSLTSKSKSNPGADAIFTIFGGAQIADIKRYIYLANDKGEKRELAHFIPPKAAGEEAVFFFPRLDSEGKPLFTAASKHLIFNLTKNDVNINTNFKVPIKPLVYDGKVYF